MLLKEFGQEGAHGQIFNGCVPVKSGRAKVQSRAACQQTSGIAGYTLLFGLRYVRMVSRQPFAGRGDALNCKPRQMIWYGEWKHIAVVL